MKATDWFACNALSDAKTDILYLSPLLVRAGHVVSLSPGPTLLGDGPGNFVSTVRLTTVSGQSWIIPCSDKWTLTTLKQELEIE